MSFLGDKFYLICVLWLVFSLTGNGLAAGMVKLDQYFYPMSPGLLRSRLKLAKWIRI